MKKTYSGEGREDYKWTGGQHGFWLLIGLLVFAFPVGIPVMWREAKWPAFVKAAVTAVWAAILVSAVVISCTTSLDYSVGGYAVTAVKDNTAMLAPLKPDGLADNAQVLDIASETSDLISVPTPTPVPTYVYCNDNGKYYHLKGCIYVYEGKTPHVTLTQALNAGKTACKLCNPPTEETYGN